MTPPTTIVTVVNKPSVGRRPEGFVELEGVGIMKFQTPTSKLQRSSKLQVPTTKNGCKGI
jgi:hypothetical protein